MTNRPAPLPTALLLLALALATGSCRSGRIESAAGASRGSAARASAGPNAVIRDLLPYNDRLDRRELAAVDLVVVHCTELPSMAEAREYGEKVLYAGTGTGNSGHYYIDRDGTVTQYVEDDRVAHHVVDFNPRSIGIELVNRGRYPDWNHSAHQETTEEYPPEQVAALVDLIAELQRRMPGITRIARHSDLDQRWVPATDDPGRHVRRKIDPGAQFPWDRLVAAVGLTPLQSDPIPTP
jgi:N-acetylmuramoyl-L-alanine amidase